MTVQKPQEIVMDVIINKNHTNSEGVTKPLYECNCEDVKM